MLNQKGNKTWMLGKIIIRIKWHIKEFVKTLSNEPSFYSSKRIERCIIFLNANIMLDICTYSLMRQGKIDWLGAVGVYSAQMVYAGYQVKKTMEESKKDAPPTG